MRRPLRMAWRGAQRNRAEQSADLIREAAPLPGRVPIDPGIETGSRVTRIDHIALRLAECKGLEMQMDEHELEYVVAAILTAAALGGSAHPHSAATTVEGFREVIGDLRETGRLAPARTLPHD
jgi:hypothetical protein